MRTPILVRTYDFMVWLFGHTTHFPKAKRQTLTNRLEGRLLDFQCALALANRRRGDARRRTLDEADGLLDGVRFLVRFATDLGYLSSRQYEFASKKLAEIGRLLGGWRRVS